MLIYFGNLFLILFWMLVDKVFNDKKTKTIIIIIFIQLFLTLALRSPTVGVDTNRYIELFNWTKKFPFWTFGYSRHEYGYIMLNKILQFIDCNQIFISIISFIPLYIFFKFILRQSNLPILSIYLFVTLGFYTNMFNLFRQTIAISIITISYRYLKENNFKSFCICVFIASSFHVSALAFLIAYFVRNNKLNYKSVFIYFNSAMLFIMFGKQFIYLLLNKFSSLDYAIESRGGFVLLSVLIMILLTGIIFKQNILNNNERTIVLFNILILAILVQLLALYFALFTRVTSYFRIFLIIFIPEIIDGIKSLRNRRIGLVLVIFLTGVQFYMNLSSSIGGIVPYSFFI